jgi:sugar (pentulose or hexulose) kinase
MNSGDGYILTIDCGTQSVRAILFNSRGSIVGKEKVEFEPYFSTQPGWAEQHADVFWDNACKACQTLKAQQPEDWNKIVGVTVTTQRDTTVLIDKEGQPLRPAIIWLDQRMAQCREPLPLHHQIMFKAVGMSKTLELIRRQTKTNWIRENEPELWEKTYKCLLLSGYFIFQLTGRYADSVGSQIGHIPFDYKRQCWAKPLDFKWPLFGIEREKLYDLAKPGEPIAPITAQAASATGIKEGTPVIAAGSDKGCETLGVGCLDPSCASMSFGTTATVQITASKYLEPLQFMPPYPASIPGLYNPEVEIFRGYWMISWFKKEYLLIQQQRANELAGGHRDTWERAQARNKIAEYFD